jgi:hypothetical protein
MLRLAVCGGALEGSAAGSAGPEVGGWRHQCGGGPAPTLLMALCICMGRRRQHAVAMGAGGARAWGRPHQGYLSCICCQQHGGRIEPPSHAASGCAQHSTRYYRHDRQCISYLLPTGRLHC